MDHSVLGRRRMGCNSRFGGRAGGMKQACVRDGGWNVKVVWEGRWVERSSHFGGKVGGGLKQSCVREGG